MKKSFKSFRKTWIAMSVTAVLLIACWVMVYAVTTTFDKYKKNSNTDELTREEWNQLMTDLNNLDCSCEVTQPDTPVSKCNYAPDGTTKLSFAPSSQNYYLANGQSKFNLNTPSWEGHGGYLDPNWKMDSTFMLNRCKKDWNFGETSMLNGYLCAFSSTWCSTIKAGGTYYAAINGSWYQVVSIRCPHDEGNSNASNTLVGMRVYGYVGPIQKNC